MKRIRRVGELCRPIGLSLRLVELQVEDHLGPATCGPANRLRISPALVTDDDAEHGRTSPEDVPLGAGRVCPLFRWIDLDLVLESSHSAVRVDDDRRRAGVAIR